MRKPRIGLNLMFLDARPLSGPGVYTVELVERLVTSDEVELIGYIQPCALKHFSLRVRDIMRPLTDLKSRGARVLFEQLKLPFTTRRDRIDLLFSPAFVSPLWGAPRMVATIHDMYYAVVPELISAGQRRYWSLMIPLTARVCDALIAVSNNTRRDTERIIPAARGKVFAIPLASRFQPPDTPLPRPPEAETPFLLLVANVTANKNPSIVIAALATLVAAGRTMRLVHVGNDEFGYLAAAASANGVDAHVVQLGKVSDARLASLYAHAAATVVVSLYEGFGLPVLEAQTFGSPLVCANRASLPEVAGKGAIMVDPTDSAAIADAVARIVDNPGFAAVLRERGIANAASFSWDRTAAETLALFQRIVAEQSI